MHISTSIIACLAASTVHSTTLPDASPANDVSLEPALEARDIGPEIEVIGIAAVMAAAIITKIAIEIGADVVKSLGEWDKTSGIWHESEQQQLGLYEQKNYDLRFKELTTISHKCMYMTGNNQFYTAAEGGDANLSYTYDTNCCTFDKATSDLACREVVHARMVDQAWPKKNCSNTTLQLGDISCCFTAGGAFGEQKNGQYEGRTRDLGVISTTL
ncbi:hypothetical protein Q7P37_008685 [Cladosporium fusiforme]